jgi:Kef-type K+ transport system membrane component KefB
MSSMLRQRRVLAAAGLATVSFMVGAACVLLSAQTKGGEDRDGAIVAGGVVVLLAVCIVALLAMRPASAVDAIARLVVALLLGAIAGWPLGFVVYSLVGGSWQHTDDWATIVSLLPGCLVFGAVASGGFAPGTAAGAR